MLNYKTFRAIITLLALIAAGAIISHIFVGESDEGRGERTDSFSRERLLSDQERKNILELMLPSADIEGEKNGIGVSGGLSNNDRKRVLESMLPDGESEFSDEERKKILESLQ